MNIKERFKESGLWLVFVVLILSLFFGVVGYELGSRVNIDSDKKEENNKDNSNDKVDIDDKKTDNEIKDENSNDDANEEINNVLEYVDEDETINKVEFEEWPFIVKSGSLGNGAMKFSINGKYAGGSTGIYGFKNIKNNYLYFRSSHGGDGFGVLYNRNAEEVFKDDKNFIGKSVGYDGKDTITVYYFNVIGDYAAVLCQEDDYSKVTSKTITYNVLDNGKLEEASNVSRTIKEVINEKYNMTCEELKTTNDPKYEYDKYYANGEW